MRKPRYPVVETDASATPGEMPGVLPAALKTIGTTVAKPAPTQAKPARGAVLLRSLEKNKVQVPRDLRIVSFDDDKYATLVGVPLTTVHQPCRDIAIAAFHAMLDRIAEPGLPARTIFLTPQLVVRESCGAYLPRKER